VEPSTTVKASEPPRCRNAPPATRGSRKKSAKEKTIESTMVTVTAPRLISMSSALALTFADQSIGRGAQVQHLDQSDHAADEGQPDERRGVDPAGEIGLAQRDAAVGATCRDRPGVRPRISTPFDDA